MTRTRVSVALASCEGARFIDEQLQSLAEQTRPPDELVVCDDASEDDTRERVRAFARTVDFPVRVEVHEQRLGITGNFASALTRTTGDVVFFADQDDVWAPRKIERLAGVLDSEPDVGAVFCNGRCVDATGSPLGFDLWQSLGFDAREQRDVANGRAVDVFLRHVVAAGTTLAFRGEYRELCLPFPSLRSAHDAWVAFVISATAGVRALDEPLIDYRLHGDNQIGIQRLGFLGQLRKAREQLADDAFGYAVQFFEEARTRLRSDAALEYGVGPETIARVDEKIAHARRRQSMSPQLVRRLPEIAAELRAGGYERFSYGWRSVAQDLFLR